MPEAKKRKESLEPTFRDSQNAFRAAIKAGRLSANPNADNYAGRYMYMGHQLTRIENGTLEQRATFKNRNTRAYDV